MGGGSPRRRMAVPMFLRESTTISPMHVIFAHIVPLFAGWRRCWLYACTLENGLRHFGFLQTIPTTLEWQDCMLKICNNRNTGRTFKLCTTNFISWILQWQPEECNNFFQWHEIEKLKKQKNKYKEPWKRIKMIACSGYCMIHNTCIAIFKWASELLSLNLLSNFRRQRQISEHREFFSVHFDYLTHLVDAKGQCEEPRQAGRHGQQLQSAIAVSKCLQWNVVISFIFIHVDIRLFSLKLMLNLVSFPPKTNVLYWFYLFSSFI